MEKLLYGGDGILIEGAAITGLNAIQVHRKEGCMNMDDPNVLDGLYFCMNIWDTTPCSGNECEAIRTKISGWIDSTSASENFICGIVSPAAASQVFVVAATDNNTVKDNPANRLIIALADNPREHVFFDIRDDD